ncbi:MAG: M23 family metallopeptidase [Candidatus Margulisbacteria bacterium]|jgi:murein DD-endopeptidase MepM/ murein hydrolase activator NlpD|nr:M23 family metallopeptidase [Candidatus Margulisiibacteriota bacterium]
MVNQRESAERKRYVTFMVLPHNSTREVFRLNLPHWLAWLLGIFLAALATGLIIFFLYSVYVFARLGHYYALQAENRAQAAQIKTFYQKTKELETGIRELEERDQELREILGLKKLPLKMPNRKTGDLKQSDLPEAISQNIAALAGYISAKNNELKFWHDLGTAIASKFNYLPSESPVPGTVLSRFGLRIHPFSGKSTLHTGVDIPIWEGCPVRAAADGYVTYSGWISGYGNCVIIDHQNNYRTLYGHNQRNLAKRGDRIKKGQAIANAGSTGLSTGPHVHYQVEYKNSAINPDAFLNLNIRSASRLVQ